MARAARLTAGIGALAAALWLLVGRGLVNYDTLYSLVWGRQIAQGQAPDIEVALAPTPHPLATLAGVVASPLSMASDAGVHGEPAQTATLVVAFVALALLGWVVYALGTAWFDPWVGVLAAVIVLTRRPVLDFGARAYVDIPYVVLVLGALLVETRRPRAGLPGPRAAGGRRADPPRGVALLRGVPRLPRVARRAGRRGGSCAWRPSPRAARCSGRSPTGRSPARRCTR